MTRILALDTNLAILDILVQLLSLEGYEVQVASHFDQALDLLRAKPFDLLISDYTFTKIRGPDGEGLRQLTDAAHGAPVIILTGYGAWAELELVAQQVHDIVAKPFNIGDLAERVRMALNEQALPQEAL